MKHCDNCPMVKIEQWPKGAQVAICTEPSKSEQWGKNRVLHYSAVGRTGHILRPAWCRKEKQ